MRCVSTLEPYTLNPKRAGAIAEALEYFAGRAATGFVVPEWLSTPGNARYHAAVAQLNDAVYGIIDARAQELAAGRGASQVCTLEISGVQDASVLPSRVLERSEGTA